MRMLICLLCFVRTALLYGASSLPMRSIDFPFAGDLPSNEITDIHQDLDGFIWLGTSNGLARYDGYSVQTFRSDYRQPERLSNNHITCFAEDERHIWIGTQKGVNVYDKRTMTLRRFLHSALNDIYVFSMRNTGDGSVWIAGYNTLYRLNTTNGHCTVYRLTDKDGRRVSYNMLSTDRKNTLWICSQNGLIRYDPSGDRFFRYPPIGIRNNPFFLFQDKDGHYWVSTWGDGLWQMLTDGAPSSTVYRKQPLEDARTHTPDERFFSMTQDTSYGYLWALSYNNLYALRPSPENGLLEPVGIGNKVDINKMYTRIIKTHDGNLWLSSYDRGTIISFPQDNIENHPLNSLRNDLSWTPNLLTLCQDPEHNFWFNQDRFGICLQKADDGKLLYASTELHNITIDTRVMAPHSSGKGIWSAHAFIPVVYHLQRDNEKMAFTQAVDLRTSSDIRQRITQMAEDADGQLWMTAQNKIVAWNHRTSTLQTTPPPLRFIRFAIRNGSGTWAVTSDNGLYELQLQKDNGTIACKKCCDLPFNRDETAGMLCADSCRNLWFSTSQGRILQYDMVQKRFTDRTATLNREGANVLNLQAHGDFLWVISHHKVVQYHIKDKVYTGYEVPDDYMTVNIFRDQAACIGCDGIFYAGGNGGFMAITPSESSARRLSVSAPVVLSDIKVDGESLFFSHNTASQVSDIRLPHSTRNISIEFTTQQALATHKIRYAFKLEGTDEKWNVPEEGKHNAFYNRIGKGTHHLYVKYADEYGHYGPATLLTSIEVQPAWWETIWAYIGYGLAVVMLLTAGLRLYIRRLKIKNRLQLQESITQTKIDYFTNVSHELLTPLTVISCITDYLEERYPEEQQTGIMRNHLYRLKHLLQQVLDFRKSENGQMKLKVRKGNITAFLRQVYPTQFLPVARQKQLQIATAIPEEEVWGYLDFDKTDKILYNLLSNAIKYTPAGKRIDFIVQIHADGDARSIIFRVKDEGIGIAPKEQKRVFTRFYTGSNGQNGLSNGIGLALTKELTELHHGTIELESKPGKGSVFTVTLPIDRHSYTENEIEHEVKDNTLPTQPTETLDNDTEQQEERPVILLVDDNKDLLEMMKKLFAWHYEVLTAGSGQEAITLLERTAPDIIISDVMMPEPDGLAFCRHVKSQIATSHIPVILLTAKRTSDDRIEAYNAGADGYLSKPFETKVLQAKIDNLLKTYHRRQQTFRSEDSIQLNQLEYRSEDTDFLQKMADYIHAHLDDEECNLDQLASHTNVSKSTLNRKVKAMTGLTPSDFVRNIKLKYACMMLSQRNVTVSEVAYATGFSSPKYFTKCFKKEFGITPTEYQQQKNTEKQR